MESLRLFLLFLIDLCSNSVIFEDTGSFEGRMYLWSVILCRLGETQKDVDSLGRPFDRSYTYHDVDSTRTEPLVGIIRKVTYTIPHTAEYYPSKVFPTKGASTGYHFTTKGMQVKHMQAMGKPAVCTACVRTIRE